jgi:putative phosphoribosyl transferase
VKFENRADAGRQLASRLLSYHEENVVVLGLPRGGVPVAAEIARILHARLDVVPVKKLGVPYQPELAFGAIGEGGVRVVDLDTVRNMGMLRSEAAEVEVCEERELRARVHHLRALHPALSLWGRTAIVVDDGIATGATAKTACLSARRRGAAKVVLAVPVAPFGWCENIGDAADECVSVSEEPHFFGVGQFYEDFRQVGDDEVDRCLLDSRSTV